MLYLSGLLDWKLIGAYLGDNKFLPFSVIQDKVKGDSYCSAQLEHKISEIMTYTVRAVTHAWLYLAA